MGEALGTQAKKAVSSCCDGSPSSKLALPLCAVSTLCKRLHALPGAKAFAVGPRDAGGGGVLGTKCTEVCKHSCCSKTGIWSKNVAPAGSDVMDHLVPLIHRSPWRRLYAARCSRVALSRRCGWGDDAVELSEASAVEPLETFGDKALLAAVQAGRIAAGATVLETGGACCGGVLDEEDEVVHPIATTLVG